MKSKISVFLIFTLLLCLLCGCAGEKATDKKVIAVSIMPQSAFVKAVVGENFEVVTMIPAGASPETYEPSPKEMTALHSAQVYFAIGVPAESSILDNVSDGTRLISLHEKTAQKYADLTLDGGRDPHLWLCPERAQYMVEIIAETVCQADPENAQIYRENAEEYINEIAKSTQTAKEILEKSHTKDFVVFHPSFQYYASYFGLNMHALEEHGKEATPKSLAKMVDFAKAHNIKAVFYQAEATSKQAKSFADEIGGEAVMLEPLSADYCQNIIKMAQKIAGE